jgi:hypothetical protein
MDIVQSVQGYITKIVSQGENVTSGSAGAGAAKMKILLLDQDTVGYPTSRLRRWL